MKNRILSGILCLSLFLVVTGNARGQEVSRTNYDALDASIMRPDIETLIEWFKEYETAQKAFIDEDIKLGLMELQNQGFSTSMSLLNHLQYDPWERWQGSCGNCWAWAGTGVMEIALSVQNGIKDRLSVQFLNSCKTDQYACCAGNLYMFANWYGAKGYSIPWSNPNSSYRDDSAQCSSGASAVSCGSIGTIPNYPITSIQGQIVPTIEVGQSAAIANIKNVLNQGKGIYFIYLLPSWIGFFDFWDIEYEPTLWNPDSSCGGTYGIYGGGHAVLIVGYNDDDSNPANHYWEVLNSWGASLNRPNGLFRMPMYMNYDCMLNFPGIGLDYTRGFMTLDVSFNVKSCTYSISPASNSFGAGGGSGGVSVTTQSGCAWTAAESLDWVTITSGASGTGSGTVTYAVSSNAGAERSGPITVSGQVFTGTHTITQVGPATNLLQNPGFENGRTVWVPENTSGIIYTDGWWAHSGSWFAVLGGYDTANHALYQQITIPSWATRAYVEFWYNVDTEETSGKNDIMNVEIRSSGNTLLKTLKTLSNLDKTSGWVKSVQFDVAEFIGQTVRLRFAATLNATNVTSFFIDDVGLLVFAENIYTKGDGICAGKSPCFSSIQAAINGANAYTTINITGDTYNENVVLNSPIELMLQGGWNADFTSCSSTTTINGSLTINNGGLNVKNIRVQ